jgi:hypothetical protein
MDVVEYFLDCIYEEKEPFITLDDGLECGESFNELC